MSLSDHFQVVADTISSPTPAVTVSASVTAANILGMTLPVVINVTTIIYITLLIIHKVWQMWKEYKKGENESSK